jgi:hypothetical protein
VEERKGVIAKREVKKETKEGDKRNKEIRIISREK